MKVELDLAQYDSAINQIVSDAGRADTALMGIVATAARVGNELKSVGGDIAINFSVDDSAIQKAQGILNNLDAGVKSEISFTLDGDTTASGILSDLDAGVTSEVEFQAINEGGILGLQGSLDDPISTNVEFRASGDAQTVMNDLKNTTLADETIQIKADPSDANTDLANIKEQLEALKLLAVIDIVMNLPLNIADIEGTLRGLPIFGGAVGQLLDVDQAVTSIERRTGEAIEGMDGLVSTIHSETGANFDEISGFLTDMIRSGETDFADLEATAIKTFQLVRDEGVGAAETLETANKLVAQGLAKDIPEALDVVTYAFQENANRAGDLYDFFGEFGGDAAQLKLTGKEFVDLGVASLDAGAQNLGRYGESINSLAQNIETANEPTQELLNNLNIDPNNVGIGGLQTLIEHYNGLTEATEKAATMQATFGSGGTEQGESQVMAMPDQATLDTSIEEFATKTGDAVELSITESLDKASISFQTALAEAANNAIGQPGGFLEKLQTGADNFSQAIKDGATIGEAIELALALPEGQISRIEAAIGDFLIGMLDAVARVGELLGRDMSGVRATVADKAGGQLAFNLQEAQTPEDMQRAVNTARSYGVSDEQLQSAVNTAVSESIDAGEFGQATGIIDLFSSSYERLSDEAQNFIEQSGGLEGAMDAISRNRMAGTEENPIHQLQNKEVYNEVQAFADFSDIGVDKEGLKAHVDAAIVEAETAYSDAIANLDLDAALDVGKTLEIDPADTSQYIQEQFRQAFTMAAESGDIEGADALWAKMLAIDPEFNLAGDLQMLLHDAETTVETSTGNMVSDLSETTGTVTTAYSDIESASDKAASTVKNNTGEFSAGFNAISLGSIVLLLATGNYNALATAIQSSAPGMVAQLSQISDALAGFASAGSSALSTSSNLQNSQSTVSAGGSGVGVSGPTAGGKGQIGHARGGLFSGTSVVGEEGPELISQDSLTSVLNTSSSRAIVSGLEALLGGRGGATTNNNTRNVAPVFNFYTQSQAQDMNATLQASRAIRGFG